MKQKIVILAYNYDSNNNLMLISLFPQWTQFYILLSFKLLY